MKGRHLCPGKRVAEIHIKLMLTVLFLQYPDCSLELEDGTLIDDMARLPGLNATTQEYVANLRLFTLAYGPDANVL